MFKETILFFWKSIITNKVSQNFLHFTVHSIFLKKNNFIKTSLDFGKKFKNKFRTKAGLLFHRT